jgi:tetratricopeptide (TPR) repeat protein
MLDSTRFVGWVALTLLLGGCGDSPSPQDSAAGPPESPAISPTPASLAITEYNKGVDFVEREDWDTAIACFSEAIRLKPDYAEAYYNRGIVYENQGDQAKADADFARFDALKAKK